MTGPIVKSFAVETPHNLAASGAVFNTLAVSVDAAGHVEVRPTSSGYIDAKYTHGFGQHGCEPVYFER